MGPLVRSKGYKRVPLFAPPGIWGIPCMFTVTFTAHQQRKMVRTPTFLGWRRHCSVATNQLYKNWLHLNAEWRHRTIINVIKCAIKTIIVGASLIIIINSLIPRRHLKQFIWSPPAPLHSISYGDYLFDSVHEEHILERTRDVCSDRIVIWWGGGLSKVFYQF